MLARKSILKHPSENSIPIETPLLVPSFSSKGFPMNGKNVSETNEALKISSEFLDQSILVSAYDIYYKHIPDLEGIQLLPHLVFIDSGGYETSEDHDLSSVFRQQAPIKEWDEKKLIEVFETWDEKSSAVFVNFDHVSIRSPLTEQIKNAKQFFRRFPNQLHDILLKPETFDQGYIKVNQVISIVSELADFDIIGFTEKEIGNSTIARMKNIARIRRALDEEKIKAPIHIFGSLDPLSSCLYFLAGAEIFDGLTWLRFSYWKGLSIYHQNYGNLMGVQHLDRTARTMSLANNLMELSNLRSDMNRFLTEKDFSKFTYHSERLKKSNDELLANIGG